MGKSIRLNITGNGRLDTKLLFCLLLSTQLSAQPKAFASLQPERIETGDTAGLIILVKGSLTEPKDVDFSPWASIFPISNVIRRSEWRRSGEQWTRRFTLIAFDSATLELPPLKVRMATGKPLETNELKLSVYPTKAGKEISDMAKIRDLQREPESWMDYWPWMAGFVLVVMLLFVWLRKNQRKPLPVVIQNQTVAVSISASELALQKLAQLQQNQLWKHSKTKEHYAELSLIIREYLEAKYGIAALESTTLEIQRLLLNTDFPAASSQDLEMLLEQADLVKYAQSHPGEQTHEAVILNARKLVAPKQISSPPPMPPISSKDKKTPPKSKSGKYEAL